MKILILSGSLILLCAQTDSLAATPDLSLTPHSSSGKVVVDWQSGQAQLDKPLALRLQTSEDLTSWRNVGPKVRLPAGAPGSGRLLETTLQPQAFYRLTTSEDVEFSSASSAAILGFASALQDQLELQGPMDTRRFAELYTPRIQYLSQITWEATNALFWERFNTNYPGFWNYDRNVVIPGLELQMTVEELEVFRKHGFLVSRRLVRGSFADVYYDVFVRDLPVLITTDSILHAWHRSFDSILEDLEMNQLSLQFARLLDGMAAQINTLSGQTSGLAHDGFVDAEYVIAVAQSLLRSFTVKSSWGNDVRIGEAVAKVRSASPTFFQWLWGEPQWVDFSVFRPRGHYTKSETLSRYFQAMSWCGQCNLIVAGTNSTPRQVSTALALLQALQDSGGQSTFDTMNDAISQLVGLADSMNFNQLKTLAGADGIENKPANWTSSRLTQFSQKILDGGFGFQQYAPVGLPSGGFAADQGLVPRVFSIFGQRFIIDGWAMQEQLWPRITPELVDKPGDVRRRRSTGLDVAFTTFGNAQVVPELVSAMTTNINVPFRDGYAYGNKLAAVKEVVDQVSEQDWRASIYGSWLYALRSLSAPTTGPEFPEAMRTRAWAMKNLNTQLSSWTQLRHDTVLYAKSTVTPPILCYYPDAFVEPYPEFFRRMREMALQMAAVASSMGTNWNSPGSAEGLQTFLKRFATNCTILQGIALKELAQEPRSAAEDAFVGDLVEQAWSYTGTRHFSGWYPLMFYRGAEGKIPCDMLNSGSGGGLIRCPDHDSSLEDFIVTDVQVDGPSDPDLDPGGTLHQGIGKVRFLFSAIDNGTNKVMYAGPVFSHYEFWSPYGVRQTDEVWKEIIKHDSVVVPADPPWTQSFVR